jgi:branched-chain amino acid transport system permease protein
MEIYLQFLILGLGSGAIIAALALGLVITYRASGVVNLGYGAIAAYVAYIFSSLRDSGAYPLLPAPDLLAVPEALLRLVGIHVELPSIPAFIEFGQPLSLIAAVVLSLGTAFLLGLALHFLVFRPLRYAPVLAKVVASVGIMLILQSAIVLRFGSRARVPGDVLPTNLVSIAGVQIPVDRLILLGAVVVLAAALWALFKYTRFGIATRAAAENEKAATFLGVSADFQAGVSWVLATLTAGLVGILVAPITGLVPARFTLLIVPAIGAALLGRLNSFGVATAAGLAIGMLQSELFLLETRWTWLPDIHLQSALPFLVIVVAMFLLGRSLPTRDAVVTSHLPAAVAPRVRPLVIVALSGATVAGILFAPPEYRDALNNTMIGVLYALSLVVITGYVGQISLVQSALAGLAAFGLATFYTEKGLPLELAALGALASAVAVGLIVAIPAARVRGASLAIVTLASAVAIQELVFEGGGWFGAVGSKLVDAPRLFGLEFGTSSHFFIGDGTIPAPGFGLFVFAVTLLSILAVMRLRRSALGDRMLAVRSNERAAAAAGINVTAIKLSAFGISAFLAGLAGIANGLNVGAVTASSFGVFPSLTIFALAYLGGISTVGGAIWTGIIFTEGVGTVLTDEVVEFGRYTSYIAGIFVVVNAVFYSDGIDGSNRRMLAFAKRKLARRRHDDVARKAGAREKPSEEVLG